MEIILDLRAPPPHTDNKQNILHGVDRVYGSCTPTLSCCCQARFHSTVAQAGLSMMNYTQAYRWSESRVRVASGPNPWLLRVKEDGRERWGDQALGTDAAE